MGADVRMKGFQSRSTVEEALKVIDDNVELLGQERLPFNLALGRILAEDIVADRNVPPHPKSAMDGYAVRAENLPGKLKIVGQIMAADEHSNKVGDGQAVRIMTGARLPEGADTVVMVEDTKTTDDVVEIERTLAQGTHVLKVGEDLTDGATVLAKGRRLRPQDVAMLVSVGALEVNVQRRPRVRFVPTGSELVRVGMPRGRTHVTESNSFMLSSLAERDGAEALFHPIVRDDPDMLKHALTEPGADLIVMTGGSSVGQEDLGPVILREIGELPVHGVHIKPASPTGIGFIHHGTKKVPVVLAPGYPVACFVAWDMFGRRIVQRQAGAKVRMPYRTVQGKLQNAFKKPEVRTALMRVLVDDDGGVTIIKGGAALLSTATRADGFVKFEPGAATYEVGTEVTVHLYD